MVFVIKILFIISRLLFLSWSYKFFDFIHHCFEYEMGSEWVCNEMNDLLPSNEMDI